MITTDKRVLTLQQGHAPLRAICAVVALLTTLGADVNAQQTTPRLPTPAPVAASLDARFAAAMIEYELNHWQQAYDEFAQLGSAGHAEAARIALQMSRFGVQLYGVRLVASRKETQRWLHVAGCGQLPAAQGCLPTLAAR